MRPLLITHREAVKFLVTGGACFVITVVINYVLKLTVLRDWPVTALTIATVISLIVSYLLNRQWSFRTRGGRPRHHELFLFFLVSAIGIGLNDLPLYISRYALDLRVPDVSRPAQEVADFLSGIIIGTLLAMVFRLWAFKRFVFPDANARSGGKTARPSGNIAQSSGKPARSGQKTVVPASGAAPARLEPEHNGANGASGGTLDPRPSIVGGPISADAARDSASAS